MFQATRRRLALWYTIVTAVLLLLFASGFYLYVRTTLVERIDDTLNHVVEVIQRSLVIEPIEANAESATVSSPASKVQPLRVNLEASFRSNADAVEDDHIDLEWFSPTGELLWSTFSVPLNVPIHADSDGETVYVNLEERSDKQQNQHSSTKETPTDEVEIQYHPPLILRQVTQRVEVGRQVLGYLRVSHPWFEVTKPSRQLIRDLSLGIVLMVGAVAAIGWFLSGLAIAPVRDSYQRLKQFTADASHELRNPIAVIQTNVQVALADPDPQLQQNQLRVVERLTRRLGRLVDNLLFLTRQDSGMILLQLDVVNLEDLLQEVLEEQQAIASDKALTLSLKLPDRSPAAEGAAPYLVHADRDQLIRLFTNLISNAVQYTPPHGEVEVSLEALKHQGNHQLRVQIRDTGIGIPAESLPHLFDRFYRVDPARTALEAQRDRKSGTSTGSGLGLAIAQAIVENHQGQIQVSSTLNQGTIVTVTLPCHRVEFSKSVSASTA